MPEFIEGRHRRRSTRRSLVLFNLNILLRSVFDNFCGPATFLFVAFVLSLGIQGESMGRLTLAASMGCVFQLLMLPLVTRLVDRKRFILVAGIAEPLVLMAAVLTVALLPQSLRIYALAAAAFASAAFLNMSRPMADDWLASTIPGALRGRYLGRRFQLLAVVSVVAILAGGWMGDTAGRLGAWGLAIVEAVGASFGVMAIVALSRVRYLGQAGREVVELADLPRVFAHHSFRRFILGYLLYNFPFFFAVSFYQVFNHQVLHMNNTSIAMMMVGYSVMNLVFARPWGRAVDRWGPRRVTMLVGPLYVAFFLLLSLAGPGRLWPVCAAWACAGLGDAAFAVSTAAARYAAVPQVPGRPAFFAVANLMTFGLYGIGGVMAEGLLRLMDGVQLTLGPLTLGRYHIFYGACGLLMPFCMFGPMIWVQDRSPRRPMLTTVAKQQP